MRTGRGKIMVSEEATPARYNRVLPQFKYVVKRALLVLRTS